MVMKGSHMLLKKTEELFEFLCDCAWEMRTVTEGEASKEIGLGLQRLGPQLGEIRDVICLPRGAPWLSALVVDHRTRRPDSFFPEGFEHRGDLESFWRNMVTQVYDYDWITLRRAPDLRALLSGDHG